MPFTTKIEKTRKTYETRKSFHMNGENDVWRRICDWEWIFEPKHVFHWWCIWSCRHLRLEYLELWRQNLTPSLHTAFVHSLPLHPCVWLLQFPQISFNTNTKKKNYYREKLQPQKKNFNRMHPWPCQTITARVVKIYRFINNKILLKIFINKHTIRSNNLDKISKFILFNKLLFI